MYRIQFLPVVVLALVLGACSRNPLPAGHEATFQRTIHSAGHWEILATETAAQISGMRESVVTAAEANAKINDNEYIRPTVIIPDGATFFVAKPDPTMPFARSFHDMVLTKMVQEGVPVTLSPEGAHVLHYTVQPVSHDRGYHKPLAGSLTALGAGVAAIGAIASTSTSGAAGLALGLADLASSTSGEFPFGDIYSEVVVTLTLIENDSILMRRSNVYYVDAMEIHQYAGSPAMPLTRYSDASSSEPLGERKFWVVSE